MATITTRMNNRITDVDRRVDGVELLVVRDYVSRNEFVIMQTKIEQHMVRIEEKLDRMLERAQ